MSRLIRKTELARIAGVSAPSITLACRRAFPAALVGLRVDVDHVDVQKYLANKPGALTRLAEFFAFGGSQQPHAPQPASTPPELAARVPQRTGAARRFTLIAGGDGSTSIDIEAAMSMQLREIIARWGSLPQFVDALDAVRRMTEIREREIKIAERMGRLVSRELVRASVLSHLEGLHRRLFSETALVVARRLHQIGRAGQPVEDAERLMRELFAQVLKPTKAATSRALRAFENDDHDAAPQHEGNEVAHE